MTIKKYVSLIIITGLFSAKAFAQADTIKGHVYDLQSHQPIAGAVVHLAGSTEIVLANDRGFFAIPTTQNSGQLHISVIGYKSQIIHFSSNNNQLNIQLAPDPTALNDVHITAFGNNKTLKQTAGAIAVLSSAQINQGSGISLQQALNSIPGVRMDQSNLADSRISIRGNGVRSPWGMRNVKVFINNIPLTEVDGTTRIEALDISDLGQAEIIKGPASSIYGGGTGGVIKFQIKRSPYQEQSLEASAMAGSFGLGRIALTYRGSTDNLNSFVSYGQQYYGGYREHSSDQRKFIMGNFQWFPSNKRTITLLLSRTSQVAEIPGTLDANQVRDNRRQAAPIDLDKHAGREQNWTRIGIEQDYNFNNQFSNATSVFTYFYDLHHPLPFGIIRNFYQSYGGRTQFTYKPFIKSLPTTLIAGGEFNQALTKGTQYVNNHGIEGAIMNNTDYNNTVFSLFLQAETKIRHIADVTLGISYNGLIYHVTDYLNPSNGGVKRFKPQASPRIAVSHDFGKWLSLSGSISSGYSPPTTEEIKNANQTINKNLQPERGTNYEIDAKGDLFQSRVSYALSLFRMNMIDELIPQTVSQSVTIYHNSGKTKHNGVELALSWQPIKPSDHKAVSALRPYLAVTYSDFTFKNYHILNSQNEIIQSFDGNQLTGIAPWVISAGIDFATRVGIYAHADFYYNDKQPLNDSNTDFNNAFSVLNVKVGYRKSFGKHFGLDVYAGVNNLTNSLYSSFTALNALAANGQLPAYYNPSPTRNSYVGLNFKYYIKPNKTAK